MQPTYVGARARTRVTWSDEVTQDVATVAPPSASIPEPSEVEKDAPDCSSPELPAQPSVPVSGEEPFEEEFLWGKVVLAE